MICCDGFLANNDLIAAECIVLCNNVSKMVIRVGWFDEGISLYRIHDQKSLHVLNAFTALSILIMFCIFSLTPQCPFPQKFWDLKEILL